MQLAKYLYYGVHMVSITSFTTPGKDNTVLGRTANTIPVAGVTWLRIRFQFQIRVEKDTYSLYYCQEKSGRWRCSIRRVYRSYVKVTLKYG